MKTALEYNKIGEVMKLIDTEISNAVQGAPELVGNDIKAAMNAPHSGRIYRRRSIQHRASAPGEAPAIDTEGYVGSIRQRVISRMRAEIYSNAPQALALEFGRPERNLAPRPAWIPAAKRTAKEITKSLKSLKDKIEHV